MPGGSRAELRDADIKSAFYNQGGVVALDRRAVERFALESPAKRACRGKVTLGEDVHLGLCTSGARGHAFAFDLDPGAALCFFFNLRLVSGWPQSWFT